MQKARLPAIEYIRGISMAGVIGIHMGAQYLTNPQLNVHLLAIFEVVTRFSVPIFFFISAFGLFYNLNPHEPFAYGTFLRRRARTVLVPYIVWSLFYLSVTSVIYGVAFPDVKQMFYVLFFGLAQYQLYFLVILLWFYLLMPLWIFIMRRLDKKWLLILLVWQIAVNYFSSFNAELYAYTQNLPDGAWLKSLLQYRLNYWVGHYFFIFLLGGWCAWHFDEFKKFMKMKQRGIVLVFMASLVCMLVYYYSLLVRGFTPLEAIFTAHQLCPLGVIYTVTSSIFFFTVFTYPCYPAWLNKYLSIMGKHSYFAYLVHPVFIALGSSLLTQGGKILTAPIVLAFYAAVLTTSLATAAICRWLGQKCPLLNILTIGVYPKNKSAK